MTVPQTRDALVGAADRSFSELGRVVDGIPEGDRSAAFPGEGRDRDIRDVLNHLHAWHVLLLGWLDDDAAGRSPAYPAEGYDWGSLDALNTRLRDEYRDVDLDEARARLRASHRTVLDRLEGIDDAALFDEDGHSWLRGPLAEPVHECLGGHYEWALQSLDAARAPR